MKRPFLIAGNWKMNNGPAATESFFESFNEVYTSAVPEVQVLICPPAVSIPFALANKGPVLIGAQNMHFENDGAYTGEISAGMLTELGCTHVIIGHSERREYFGETDTIVAKKVKKALDSGLTPVMCVGEVLAERKQGLHFDIVKKQVREGLKGLTAAEAERVVVAYEPVWAIGTGETASPEQAQEMHAFIRSEITHFTTPEVAHKVIILYGGSMKPDNAEELLSQPDVDGGLIGGASLKPDVFFTIVKTATKLR